MTAWDWAENYSIKMIVSVLRSCGAENGGLDWNLIQTTSKGNKVLRTLKYVMRSRYKFISTIHDTIYHRSVLSYFRLEYNT